LHAAAVWVAQEQIGDDGTILLTLIWILLGEACVIKVKIAVWLPRSSRDIVIQHEIEAVVKVVLLDDLGKRRAHIIGFIDGWIACIPIMFGKFSVFSLRLISGA